MSTLRPLGVGSQVLTHGDRMAGFYGEVSNIISADELRNIAGVTQGTPMQTGDITWLKFSHNYKTLYVAKKAIQNNISWDILHIQDCVFGRMVEIGGCVYLLRLLQGSTVNPSDNIGGVNSEWDNLMVRLVNNWGVYLASDIISNQTMCQEVRMAGLEYRLVRGTTSNISYQANNLSNYEGNGRPWQPVLELLYKK